MQTQTTALSALKDTTRVYPGCKILFRLTSEETNNALAVLEMSMIHGSEPPRHYHETEDETLIIRKGTITFFVGNDIINAEAGATVFIPRGTFHHFVVTSDVATATLILTPGGLEHFFESITMPVDNNEIPPVVQSAFTPEDVKRMKEIADKFRIRLA